MDIVARKKINILIQVAQIDHELLQSEVDLIREIGRKNHLTTSEIDELFSNPEVIGSLGALSSKQKFDYLYDCIRVIKADGIVKKSEVIFAQSIAINLGFKKDIIDELIRRVDLEKNEDRNRRSVQTWFMENAL